METAVKEFDAYSVGLVCASVCSSLSIEETTKCLNREHPTGISSTWKPFKDKRFSNVSEGIEGKMSPCTCNVHPKTHKHYLFNC